MAERGSQKENLRIRYFCVSLHCRLQTDSATQEFEKAHYTFLLLQKGTGQKTTSIRSPALPKKQFGKG